MDGPLREPLLIPAYPVRQCTLNPNSSTKGNSLSPTEILNPRLGLGSQALSRQPTQPTIHYQPNGGLEAFVDADWASQLHRHSMSGYVVLLNGGPVAWSARKQPLIALKLLIEELYEPPVHPIPVFKHIDLRYHFVRSHVRNGTFDLLYCPTDENVADAFTKALARPRLQKLRTRMGLACARGGVLSSESSESSESTNTDGSAETEE